MPEKNDGEELAVNHKKAKYTDGRIHSPAEKISRKVTKWTGSSFAFVIALGVIVVWALLGPVFDYSDTWQLVINTGTTIVTFLMVFLIQRGQNIDTLAMQLKLNELIASIDGASNRLLNLQDMSEEEIEAIHRHFVTLAKLASATQNIRESHSIEEAERRHEVKGKLNDPLQPKSDLNKP